MTWRIRHTLKPKSTSAVTSSISPFRPASPTFPSIPTVLFCCRDLFRHAEPREESSEWEKATKKLTLESCWPGPPHVALMGPHEEKGMLTRPWPWGLPPVSPGSRRQTQRKLRQGLRDAASWRQPLGISHRHRHPFLISSLRCVAINDSSSTDSKNFPSQIALDTQSVSNVATMPSKAKENLPETNEGYGTRDYWYGLISFLVKYSTCCQGAAVHKVAFSPPPRPMHSPERYAAVKLRACHSTGSSPPASFSRYSTSSRHRWGRTRGS